MTDVVLALVIWQSGEDGLRSFGADVADETPRLKFGELLLSDSLRSGSRTEIRVGEEGKVSSIGLRGMRIRLGDPEGLCGRIWGEYSR